MGDYNQLVVLDQIRRASQSVSRVELASTTGLSGQTISNVVGRLLELGLIEEGERQIAGRGKPRTMLHLRAAAGYALGVHVDPVSVTTVLIDLAGTMVDRSVVTTPDGPTAVIDALAGEVARMQALVPDGAVVGLGVAAPGPIDPEGGRVIHPPLMQSWGDVPLRDRVADATGLPTLLEKDVAAAMVAELWQGDHDIAGTTLFVYLGFGVGFAFARGGEVLSGSSRNAGEIGHLIVDADGPECFCGNRGCLGVSVSLDHLVAEAVAAGVLAESTPRSTPAELDLAMGLLATASQADDGAATEILARASRRLARGIVVISDLLDADRVVVGGANWERFRPQLSAAARTEFAGHATLRELHGVEMGGAALGPWLGAVGAASRVLDAAFTPHASILLAQPVTA
ncbi:ROK family transcriptional regulator [Oerskovia flava]|uniref:ROK family transcriptional regulator n=1 Tax=Oerskovia flava TaxID=2986422 RepID=UPI00223F6FC0|nr:ROK family transcriptional regulator [Oerskovia sp. JB1-3-2]